MSSILISHLDLDGLGSVILSLFYNIPFNEIWCWKNDYYDINTLSKYQTIVFADLSISEDIYKSLIKIKKNIYIFDHHETSSWISKYKSNKNIININECGTKIFYKNFINPEVINSNIETFVNLVDVYDRWQTHEETWKDALNLQRIFSYYVSYSTNALIYKNGKMYDTPYFRFINNMLYKLHSNEFKFNRCENEIINTMIDEEKEAYELALDNIKFRVDNKNINFGIYECSNYASIIANKLLEEYTEIKYLIILYPKNKSKLSLRSRNDFNCLSFKGLKGHRNACGGVFSEKYIDDLYEGKIHQLAYK